MRGTFRGIALMIASQFVFIFNDTLVKLAGEKLPMGAVIFLRGCFAVLLLGGIAFLRGEHRDLPRLRDRQVLLRLIGELGGTAFYLMALFRIPIATVTIVFQATPLATTAAAALFLREPVGWGRWLAILIGFGGVLLVVRPGLGNFQPAALLVLVAVLFVTLRDVSTRAMPATIPTFLVAAATALAVTVLGAGIGLTETWIRPQWTDIAGLALAAAALGMGYVLIIAAMRTGEVSVTAPFRYASVVIAIASGYLVWGDVPDSLTLLGSAIIIAMGLFTVLRERSPAATLSPDPRLSRSEASAG